MIRSWAGSTLWQIAILELEIVLVALALMISKFVHIRLWMPLILHL